jgi:hypothetical protein
MLTQEEHRSAAPSSGSSGGSGGKPKGGKNENQESTDATRADVQKALASWLATSPGT